jgi:ATP-dependent RNA helicase HelY
VLSRLDAQGLLPAITFIFSRAGCAGGGRAVPALQLRLNTAEEAERVRHVVERRTSSIPREDLGVLGYWNWLDGLQRGIAAHHAGMLPTFKEVVEELFVEGLVKAVFATETLALGINMPARSVVLEKLVKWNGETHADVTPGEYTQLTGRAGRRGIDVEGHAVVLWQPGMDPRTVAGLASTRTYPLRSSFRPSYNMAVNLVGSLGREAARTLLESSFAQFQADASVVGLARQVARNLEGLEGYREAMTCHLGDAQEYGRLRAELTARETELARTGATQRPGRRGRLAGAAQAGRRDPVPVRAASGLAVVLDPGVGHRRRGAPARAHRGPLGRSALARRLPVGRSSGRPPAHPQGASTTGCPPTAATWRPPAGGRRAGPVRGRRRSAAADDDRLAALRAALRRHPVHGCEDRESHLRWAERWQRLRAETDALERRVAGKTSSIARTFDRVCAVLDRLGYLDGGQVTPPASSSPASTASPTCSRSRACAPGCGTHCRRPSSRPSCPRSSTPAAAPTSRTPSCPPARCRPP